MKCVTEQADSAASSRGFGQTGIHAPLTGISFLQTKHSARVEPKASILWSCRGFWQPRSDEQKGEPRQERTGGSSSPMRG